MLYLVLFKARFHLSCRVVCPKQYVSICPDYLRLQNDIQAETLRQEGGKGIFSLLLCEQKYQIRNLKMCHLLIQSNTISPLQEQHNWQWNKESITCLHWLHLANGKAQILNTTEAPLTNDSPQKWNYYTNICHKNSFANSPCLHF